MTPADTPDALEELRGLYASDRDNYDERGIIGHRITRFIVSPEAPKEIDDLIRKAFYAGGIVGSSERLTNALLLLLAQKGLGK